MSVPFSYDVAVDALRHRVASTFPTKLTAELTARGVPTQRRIVRWGHDEQRAKERGTVQAEGDLPRGELVVDGFLNRERWATPQADERVPVLVRITVRAAHAREVAEDVARLYGVALVRTLDTVAINAPTGAWWWDLESVTVIPAGNDPSVRTVEVRGLLLVRTIVEDPYGS